MAIVIQAGYKYNSDQNLETVLRAIKGVRQVWMNPSDVNGQPIPDKVAVELVDVDPFDLPILVEAATKGGIILDPVFGGRESLAHFRHRYPHKPHDRVWLRGDDDKVMAEVEVISYPWPEANDVRIKIRLVPNEPASLAETSCLNLIRVPKLVRCNKHKESFSPRAEVCSAYTEDRNQKTLIFYCPLCARGYVYQTLAMFDDHGSNDAKVDTWHSDREIIILER